MKFKSILLLFLCFSSTASSFARDAFEGSPTPSFCDLFWSVFKASLAGGLGGMLGGEAMSDEPGSLMQKGCRLGSVAVIGFYGVCWWKVRKGKEIGSRAISSSRAWQEAHDVLSTAAFGVFVGAGVVKIASIENQSTFSEKNALP